MLQTLAIAAGGALGAALRYWTSVGVHSVLGREFPYGTLTVNVAGSLLIGLLAVLLLDRFNVEPVWRAGLLVGVLGAFTTFSTFSFETLNLLEQGDIAKGVLNSVLNFSLCLFATWLGLLIGRQL
ncbi:MAG: fluoride efflux transporter CrcB [Gammaproteobacteria bacterium]